MSLPQYSASAGKVRARFIKTVLHCYVEAAEDKLFWKSAISLAQPRFNVRFHEVGDCKGIDKIIEKIIEGDKQKMAIRDSDYLEVINSKFENPRVIYTFGYSMENSLYSPRNITQAINHLSSSEKGIIKNADTWLRKCFEDLSQLIFLDIADIKLGKGIGVLGDSGTKYVSHDKDCIISSEKVESRIREIEHLFTEQEKNNFANLVMKYKKRKYLIIRGHLMTHLVLNFINREVDRCKPVGKKGKLNHGSIYAQLVGQIGLSTLDSSEFSYIKKKIEQIHQELRI